MQSFLARGMKRETRETKMGNKEMVNDLIVIDESNGGKLKVKRLL